LELCVQIIGEKINGTRKRVAQAIEDGVRSPNSIFERRTLWGDVRYWSSEKAPN
jgi:hypothetical protein